MTGSGCTHPKHVIEIECNNYFCKVLASHIHKFIGVIIMSIRCPLPPVRHLETAVLPHPTTPVLNVSAYLYLDVNF